MSSGPSRRRPRVRLPGVGALLALACFLSAMVLGFSEFSTTFEFTPPGGEPLSAQTAADRHSYGLLVIAIFSIFLLGVAVMSGSRPAALAVAAMGALALLWFLIFDLPKAGQVGTLDDPRQSFFTAEAVPQAGFWLELVGALGLAVAGAALATLKPEQLALGERYAAWRERRRKDRRSGPVEKGADPEHRRRKASVARGQRATSRRRGD